MDAAIALGHNDVAFVAWRYDAPLAGCLGFAVHRTDAAGQRAVLPAWVAFEGDSNDDWHPSTTEVWPVQRFSWRDLTAVRGETYTYEIVPMLGTPGALAPDPTHALTTNAVTLTPQRSKHVRAYFNRGILSTQHLAHELPQGPDGKPDGTALLTHIKDPADKLRASLAGQIIEGVTTLVRRSEAEGGHCYCALYELSDPELIGVLEQAPRLSLILANAGESGSSDSTNAAARVRLHAAGVDITDRMLKSGHIGHNKFVVYVDKHGKARAVLTGSTNWTPTGLCAQSNNALVIEDPEVARAYRDYWNRLKAESAAQPATQSAVFRGLNDAARAFKVDGKAGRVWESPNTSKQTKPAKNPPRPSDMADVFAVIAGAKQAILFLLFQPGSPSVLDAILDADTQDVPLFVRGAATDPDAIDHYAVELHHRTGETAYVAAASALDDQFGEWQRELLKTPGAHAIVHDKIVVVDPLSDDCAVITGSHNLGYRASYANDDNLVVIRGHRALAEAYAVHVMDVYDHYRWRYVRERYGAKAFTGLARTDDWQDKYFRDGAALDETRFWTSAAPVPA